MDGSPDIWTPVKVFTGAHPFPGSQLPTITEGIIHGERPARPQGAQELGLTDPVWDMTLKCWKQDLTDRPTVTEVIRRLREWPVFPLSVDQCHDTFLAATDYVLQIHPLAVATSLHSTPKITTQPRRRTPAQRYQALKTLRVESIKSTTWR